MSNLFKVKVTGSGLIPRYHKECPIVLIENQDFLTILKSSGYYGYNVETLAEIPYSKYTSKAPVTPPKENEQEKAAQAAITAADTVKVAAQAVLDNNNSNSTTLKAESAKVQAEIDKLNKAKAALDSKSSVIASVDSKVKELTTLKSNIDTKATEKEKAEQEAAKQPEGGAENQQ